MSLAKFQKNKNNSEVKAIIYKIVRNKDLSAKEKEIVEEIVTNINNLN